MPEHTGFHEGFADIGAAFGFPPDVVDAGLTWLQAGAAI